MKRTPADIADARRKELEKICAYQRNPREIEIRLPQIAQMSAEKNLKESAHISEISGN